MVASAFLYSVVSLAVKLIRASSPWTLLFIRGLEGWSLACVVLGMGRIRPFWGTSPRKLLVRGVLGGGSIIFSYLALCEMDMTLAVVIGATAPQWVALYTWVVQRKDWSGWNTAGGVSCLLGTILIFFPFHQTDRSMLLGMGFALLSSLFQTSVILSMATIREEHPVVVAQYSMLVGTCCALPGMVWNFHGTENTFRVWLLLIATGGLSFLAQISKTYAIQNSLSLGVILLRYLEIVFTLLWDILFLHGRFTLGKAFGIFFVLLGCCLHQALLKPWRASEEEVSVQGIES